MKNILVVGVFYVDQFCMAVDAKRRDDDESVAVLASSRISTNEDECFAKINWCFKSC